MSVQLTALRLVLLVGLVSAGARAELAATHRQGHIRLLTYNVAGLPEGISLSHPVANLPITGKLLNRYDLAVVQEDFAYPTLLRQNLNLPYRSPGFVRGQALHFGDGLSLFGRLAFSDVQRAPWRACHGIVDAYFDCLTPKGLAMARIELAPGVLVDVYNVHLDAGASDGDVTARTEQLAQLIAAVHEISGERAVLIGGDFNLTEAERAPFYVVSAAVGLVDVCARLHCAEPWRLDRWLLRSSATLRLEPRSWRLDRSFHDAAGRPLSDHLAVAVRVDWSTRTH